MVGCGVVVMLPFLARAGRPPCRRISLANSLEPSHPPPPTAPRSPPPTTRPHTARRTHLPQTLAARTSRRPSPHAPDALATRTCRAHAPPRTYRPARTAGHLPCALAGAGGGRTPGTSHVWCWTCLGWAALVSSGPPIACLPVLARWRSLRSSGTPFRPGARLSAGTNGCVADLASRLVALLAFLLRGWGGVLGWGD